MNQPRDIERLLDQWFADGSSVAPDRVIDIVADRIERQPQRPSWRLDWRHLTMNTTYKIAAAIAAIAILGLIGWNLLPGGSTGVGGPAPTAVPAATPTASPSAAPSPSASPLAVFPTWFRPDGNSTGAGILAAGGHATKAFTPAFTFNVPEGWVDSDDETDFYGLFPDTPANQAEFARSGELSNSIFMGPHDSPYFVCKTVENNRGTAAEMTAAAAANKALSVSGVLDVAIGGLTGKRFDVRADPNWTGTCPGDPPGLDLKDGRSRVFLLDTAGGRVIAIFVGSLHAADHEAFVAPATRIVESFDFTP
ncbi:MAG: hypothetical protein ACJ77O_07645 [Chloroflexota bacterium]